MRAPLDTGGHAAEDRARKIIRPVVSDRDGTREGGLMFCISLIAGMILAGAMSGAALASFWVWCALLAAAVGIAVNVKRLVAYLNGFKEPK